MASVRANSGDTYDLARGLRLYEADGPLPERAVELWRMIAPAEMELARQFWRRYRQSDEVTETISDAKADELAARIAPYIRDKFERIASPQWVATARSFVESALAKNVSLSTLLAGLSAQTDAAFAALRAAMPEGPELVSYCRTLSDIGMIEVDVFVHHAMEITRAEVDAHQAKQANNFNQKVLGVVQRCTAESEQLRAQATTTSSAARGMLGKTSEVAAAAEQSASAMREAAQTAAGLIRAIEDARSEVEVAAGVATRAGDQAEAAVKVSQALSSPRRGDRIDPRPDPRHRRPDQFARSQRHHRGGPRRRCRPRLRGRRPGGEEPGVADRARHRRHHRQDHRHPAGDPRDGRGQQLDQGHGRGGRDVSADRIRQAMELQAQTVTMITAAVDETALAADSMSSTIAAIRSDTENVAKDIDNVEQGFGRFAEQIADFRSATSEFVSKFAA